MSKIQQPKNFASALHPDLWWKKQLHISTTSDYIYYFYYYYFWPSFWQQPDSLSVKLVHFWGDPGINTICEKKSIERSCPSRSWRWFPYVVEYRWVSIRPFPRTRTPLHYTFYIGYWHNFHHRLTKCQPPQSTPYILLNVPVMASSTTPGAQRNDVNVPTANTRSPSEWGCQIRWAYDVLENLCMCAHARTCL